MNLQKFGVQELSVQEQEEIQGGFWFAWLAVGISAAIALYQWIRTW
jgi:hypothetical protein